MLTSSDFNANISDISQLVAGAAGIDKTLISVLQSKEIRKNALSKTDQNLAGNAGVTLTALKINIIEDFFNNKSVSITFLSTLFATMLFGTGAFLLKRLFKNRKLKRAMPHDFSTDLI